MNKLILALFLSTAAGAAPLPNEQIVIKRTGHYGQFDMVRVDLTQTGLFFNGMALPLAGVPHYAVSIDNLRPRNGRTPAEFCRSGEIEIVRRRGKTETRESACMSGKRGDEINKAIGNLRNQVRLGILLRQDPK